MAQRIETFAVTVPAGTSSAAPQTTGLTFNDGIVENLEVLIPPGPSGLVGFAVLHSGDVVIPFDRTKWIVADDEVIRWPLENFPTGRAWALRAYNDDVFPHTLYIRILVRETPRSTFVRPQLVYIAPGAIAEDNQPSE